MSIHRTNADVFNRCVHELKYQIRMHRLMYPAYIHKVVVSKPFWQVLCDFGPRSELQFQGCSVLVDWKGERSEPVLIYSDRHPAGWNAHDDGGVAKFDRVGYNMGSMKKGDIERV